MIFNRDFDIVKKTGLFFLLLASMSAQASDAVVNTTSNAAAVETSADENKPTGKQPSGNHPSKNQQQGFSFPKWPESQSVQRERVPMAPPGPYMSSALSDFSFKEPSFARDFNRPNFDRPGSRHAVQMDSVDMSMEQFSPDIPWPSNANSPDRWQPEEGYRYVEPRINNRPYQAPYNPPSNYNSGNRRSPLMGRPDRMPAGRMPVMNNPAH